VAAVAEKIDPYAAARREYQDRYDSLARGRRHWQLTAWGLMVLLAIALGMNVIQVREVNAFPTSCSKIRLAGSSRSPRGFHPLTS
jgi:type IV secretory pathway TrbF-like protein